MSVRVSFRSAIQIAPIQIFEALSSRNEDIVATSDSFPCLKFGRLGNALRGIEVNKEDNGYEVRVCSFANESDLQLFAVAVALMKELTGAPALYEDDDECAIESPAAFFAHDWVSQQIKYSFTANVALARHFGKPVIMDGLFFPFCFGPVLIDAYNLMDFDYDEALALQEHLTSVQWHCKDLENTSTRLALPNPHDGSQPPLSLSVIRAEKGQVFQFDYISYADVLCLMDDDKVLMVRIDDLKDILPYADGFSLIDDCQVLVKKAFTYDVFQAMWRRAERFQVDDIFRNPTLPGHGYDDTQRTYVLMWDPAISSVTMADHKLDIPKRMVNRFNWSVFEHEQARKGDRFVLVCCGEGTTGIVMSGIFVSNPYKDDDWSGRGREIYYMDMRPNFIADPECADIITTEALETAIPSFSWRGGHSGRLLDGRQARKLEAMLADYFASIADKIDGVTINAFGIAHTEI